MIMTRRSQFCMHSWRTGQYFSLSWTDRTQFSRLGALMNRISLSWGTKIVYS